MAKPQLEDGYTMIANELLEALSRTHLSAYENRVLIILLRFTYGYHKKETTLSLSFIVQQTGLLKPHVSRALRQLSARNIIMRTGKLLTIQKDYERWLSAEVSKKIHGRTAVTPIGNGGKITPIGNKTLPRLVTNVTHRGNKQSYYKDNNKDNLKKTITKPRQARQEYQEKIETLNHKTGHITDIDILRRQGKFPDWLDYLNGAANKVSILIEAFRAWHKTAPDIDWENLGGRMAQLFTLANKDAGYLLKILWETAAADIAGSHLNFIQGKLRSGARYKTQTPSKEPLTEHQKQLKEVLE